MDRARLLEHFETIADTRNSVGKLRALVLDLAIRGDLVEQEQTDAPAQHLIHRAKAELEKRRSAAPLSEDKDNGEAPPFGLPGNWCWTCLEALGDTAPHNDLPDDAEVGFSPMRLIPVGFGEPVSFERRKWTEVRKGFTHFANGDIVLAKITPCFENGKSAMIRNAPGGYGAGTTELHVFRPVPACVLPNYVLVFLKSSHFLRNGEAHMTGTAGQKRVPWAYFARTPFPLPPLAEQKRIVAKVEELLALCDELEARQTATREQRARLVRSALDHLTGADTPEDFRHHVAFVLKEFPHLTATPDAIPAIRQAILSLAVQGGLSGHEQRGSLVQGASGTLPEGWRWVQLSQVADHRLGKMLDKQKNRGRLRPYLRNTNVHWFRIDLSSIKEMRIEDDEVAEYSLAPRDVLICEGGHGIARTAVWDDALEGMTFQKALHRVRPGKDLDSYFFAYCMKVYSDMGVLSDYFTGAGIPHLTGQSLARLKFPFPPLAEQKRIVAKVGELMRWCDQLEAQLAAAETAGAGLLDASLREVLNGAS